MINRAAIAAARRQLATQPDFLRTTPLMRVSGRSLGVECGEVWLKLEHLQVGGSFKARGMLYRLLANPVPDSGVPAAIGYAQQSGIPFELGIIRSHYVGRTFIQPSDGARHADVKRKHNANRALVEGKRIVLIDDSIVRGTTSLKIVQMMRDAGAAEVHMRIASPPTEHSCFYGVDTPERSKLLAARMDVEAMAEFIQADSLAFVSIDGLYRAVGEAGRNKTCPQYCDACFTGDYPTRLTDMGERDAPDLLTLPVGKVA